MLPNMHDVERQPSEARRACWRRRFRRLAWTGLVLSLVVLFGRHLLLAWVVAPVAGVAFGTPVDVDQAACAPTCRLDLSNLRIGEKEDAFLTTGPVEARYRLWHSLFLGPYVEKLHAEGLTVNLAQAPQGKIRLPRFRWFRRHRRREDIEDVERFLLRDLQFEGCTVAYDKPGSPLRFRVENVSASLPELREGQSGRIEAEGDLDELSAGPLLLAGGTIKGYCALTYDREMDLLDSQFSFVAQGLNGTLGGSSIAGLTVELSGTTQEVRGRGYRQDLHLALSQQGQPLGTVSIVGYSMKGLAGSDLTVRLGAEPELVNLVLAGVGLPELAEPRLELAVRGRFPRPNEAEVSLAVNLELGGETVADLDLVTRSPLPPLLQPARFSVTGERLAIDRLLAAYRQLRPDHPETGSSEPAREVVATGQPSPLPKLDGLLLPPALLDLDLRGVSYGELTGTLTGHAMVQGQQAELTDSEVHLGDGTVDLAGSIDWRTSPLKYQTAVQAAGLAFGPVARTFLAPDDGRIEGRLDTLQLDVRGTDPNVASHLSALDGTLNAQLSGLEVADLRSLRRTIHKYQLAGLGNLRFSEASLAARAAGGTFQLGRLLLNGPSGRAELTGSVGLVDRQLDLTLDAGLGPDLAADLRSSKRLKYYALLLQPRDGLACLPMPLALKGTLDNPFPTLGAIR